MNLTTENYYSFEADRQFMSVSQYKDWNECQNRAYEMYVTGKYHDLPKTAFIEGNFVHSYFHSPIEFQKYLIEFKEEIYNKAKKATKDNPLPDREMCKDYRVILKACEDAEKDNFWMQYLDGVHEVIFEAEWLGIPWKIRVDVINRDKLFMSDIKAMASFEGGWKDDPNIPFYVKYGYWNRFAIYRKILQIATGKTYKLYMPCLTKEDPSDREIWEFNNEDALNAELAKVEQNIEEIKRVKAEGYGFTSCERCSVCKKTKRPKVKEAIWIG